MHDRLLRGIAVPALAALLFCGCAHAPQPEKHDRTATDKVQDASITAAVKLALAFKPGVAATSINVDTTDGVVTLHGLVDTEAERQLAKKVAEDVSGVHDVVNDIEVR